MTSLFYRNNEEDTHQENQNLQYKNTSENPQHGAIQQKLNNDQQQLFNNDEKCTEIQQKLIDSNQIQNIIIIFLLYVSESLVNTFFWVTIPILLSSNASQHSTSTEFMSNFNQKLSILSLSNIFWSLKFLFAPIQDTYYFKQFGKRKTYIVPSQYIIALIMLISSFYIERQINDFDLVQLFTVCIIINFFQILYDVSLDGWCSTIINESNLQYASFSQNIGWTVGSFFTFNLYLWLSSEDNSTNIQSEALLNPQKMLLILMIFLIILTVIIHFFKKEESLENNGYGQLCYTVKNIKYFYKNNNIFYLMLFFLTSRMGFFFTDYIVDLHLLQNGFSKELFSTISVWMLPLEILFAIFAMKFTSQKNEFRIYLCLFFLKALNNIFSYFIIEDYTTGNDHEIIFYLLLKFIIDRFCNIVNYLAQTTFCLRICDQEYGGTYITFLYAIYNLGDQISYSTSIYFMSIFSLQSLVIAATIYNIIYYILWFSKCLQLEKTPRSFWKLKTN